jgi:hypothetical protein
MLAKTWPRLEANGVEVREEVSRASICQARLWDTSLIIASYIAGEGAKTNYAFCKSREAGEIAAKINGNGKSLGPRMDTNKHESMK